MNRKQFCPIAMVILALYGFSSFPAKAEKSDSDPLDRFAGVWIGEGKFSGMTASAEARWEWVLGGKFLRLSISYQMKTSGGKIQTFEGHGYYQPKGEGKYDGRWFESQGNSYAIQGCLEQDGLTSLWGEPGKYGGKSSYSINEKEESLEIIDSVKQTDGSWKEFSRFKLKRKG